MPAQPPPSGPNSRRRRRQQARAEQAGRPLGKPVARHPRRLPPKRPMWQSPTAIVTGLAVIATVILIISLNMRSSAGPPTALIAPANPVAAAIQRNGTILGSSSAPVKMDAWEDYQCPYCAVWSAQWEPNVINDFVAKGIVRYQFHDYAFLGNGSPDESLQAAVAAQCAGVQNKFWDYHDWLYANQNPNGENKGWFTQARLDAIALKVGLDLPSFDTCLADPAKAAAVRAEQAAGSALGVGGTPTIFANDKPVTLSTYANLAALIASLVPATPSGVPSVSPSASPPPASPTASPAASGASASP